MNANISVVGGLQAVEVADVFSVDGHSFFLHFSDELGWKMSEWESGRCVARADDVPGYLEENEITQDMVKAWGIKKVMKAGPEKMAKGIEMAIAETGRANS